VKKNLNQATKDQSKEIIIKTVKEEKPATSKELIVLMQERYSLQPEQTTKLLIELENEDRLHFPRQEPHTPTTTKEYLLPKQAAWFWITIALATTTTIAVFTIPDTDYPLVYLRSALGIIFVLFLPGYAFIRALFPAKVPLKTSSENMDTIERVALSFGLSIVLVPTVGFLLNFTPWGIRLTPIILSMLALTVVFATVAMLREHQTKLDPIQTKR
jgi:hypothetical protein